jgi:uncharacterized iron-regulated protein
MNILTGFLIAALFAAGCSLAKPPATDLMESSLRLTENHRPGHIIHLKSGQILSFDGLIDDLLKSKIVFVGEIHDDPEHHLVQTQILYALLQRSPSVHVGFECLDVTGQQAANAYLSGRITEEDFLDAVTWDKSWGFGFQLYRTLFLAARGKADGLVALNAPRVVVSKVAKFGLGGLSQEEKKLIASEIDLGNIGHRTYLKEAFKRHPSFPPGHFDFFYEAQCVWEETMAERIAFYFRDKQGTMLIFCGNGHIIHRFGVPERVKRRMPLESITIVPLRMHAGMSIPLDTADYVWLTKDMRAHLPVAEGMSGRGNY